MKLKNFTGYQAKETLEKIVKRLEGIAQDDMTTAELAILRMCVDDKVLAKHGQEEAILNQPEPGLRLHRRYLHR